MSRDLCETLVNELRGAIEIDPKTSRFPLEAAVGVASQQHTARAALIRSSAVDKQELSDLLALFDVTSVSTARAIKAIATSGDDRSGVRDALVDIWGRCEAARSLWIDTLLAEKQGTDYDERVADLWETARLTAPEAIATALRLGEPVNGYVEFTSRILGGR